MGCDLISLGSYSRRFEEATKRQTTGEPIEEFIQLGCLLMETNADPTRLTSFCDIVSRNLGHWLDEDAPDLVELSKNDWTLNQLKRYSDKDVGKLYDALLERRPHS